MTIFKTVCHLSLSSATLIQSTPFHSLSLKSTSILFSHLCLGLPNGFFPSDIPAQTQYAPFLSPLYTECPTHLILLKFMTWRTWWAKSIMKLIILQFLPIRCYVRLKYLPQHPTFQNPQPLFLLKCKRPGFKHIQNNMQKYGFIYILTFILLDGKLENRRFWTKRQCAFLNTICS